MPHVVLSLCMHIVYDSNLVCLLVKSVSLWQHGCTSLSASVSTVLRSYLLTFSSCVNTLFTLLPQTPLKKLLNFVSC